jgi:hypothetical protein
MLCRVALFVFLRSVRRLLVTANVPSSPILVTLMMEALRSSETSVLTRATRRNIPGDAILHTIQQSCTDDQTEISRDTLYNKVTGYRARTARVRSPILATFSLSLRFCIGCVALGVFRPTDIWGSPVLPRVRSADWGCLETCSRSECWDLRQRKQQECAERHVLIKLLVALSNYGVRDG